MKKLLSLLSHSKTTKPTKDHCHTRNGNRSRITIRQALLVAALVMLSMPVFGQIYTGTSICKGSITRSDAVSGDCMHYVKTGSTSGYFMSELVDDNLFSYGNLHPISGYDINDFVIFNDTVYICGVDENGIGFYGWTDAPSTLNANWIFVIYKLYDNADIFITNVNRIKVFRSGNDLNVLLVGTYRQSDSNSYGTIIHAKNNSVCTLAYQYGDSFNDVAILEDYVVTIEEKGDCRYPHNGHQMRVLNKNQFSLYDTLFDYYSDWGQRQSFGRIRLQATDNNNFVSIYRDEWGYYFNTFSVNIGSIVFYKYYTVATSALPNIGEVAYNSNTKTLAILHNIDTIGTVAFYDCSSFPNITLSSSSYPRIYDQGNQDRQTKLLSVTESPLSAYFVLSGICQNYPIIWKTASQICISQRQLSLTAAEASIERLYWATNRINMAIHQNTYTSFHDYCGLNIKCQSPHFPIIGGEKDE